MSETQDNARKKILLVTGLSGAGKTTVLNTLEDLGWEAVDNFPIRLALPLLELPTPAGEGDNAPPLAIGFDTRTRGFVADKLIKQIKKLQEKHDIEVLTLFIDCAGTEIERRYNETRRRHPLAKDRPAIDGIAQERNLMEPLRRWAETVIDTTKLSASDLQQKIRDDFRVEQDSGMTISISSFGYSRGIPHNADLVFDMRFLRNPHWVDELRPQTGMDKSVAEYVAGDPVFDDATTHICDMVLHLLPLYEAQGKPYVNIAFGCTGGRHRSVFVAEVFKKWLEDAGYSPTVDHRNLTSRPIDALENIGKANNATDGEQQDKL